MATVWLYLNEQKNLCLSFNKLSMKRPWPGGFFLAFSHNTILLTPWMQMKTPKSNSLTRKDWFIHYCILWPVITASPQYFAPEGKKSVSLEVRCLKFIHHLPGHFDSLGKCFFFYIPWRLNMEKCLFVLTRFPGFGYSDHFVLFFSGVSSSNHNTSNRSWSITGWGQLKIRIILITKSL